MSGQKRRKTKYTGVYFNETTKKYDVKYNYKVYNPLTKKNDYKSKWIYNIATITEARSELSNLQANGFKSSDKDITLSGAFDLWKIKASGQDYSPVTIDNTLQHMNMIYQFLPADTKIKDISEDVYYKFCSDVRSHGYSDETIRSINATFRKLINLCYKRKLISENILNYADNIRTRSKEDYRIISKEEFDEIDNYLKNNSFYRLGVNCYPKYRLLVNILYYTGIRVGECLALTYNDFEEFDYYRKSDEKSVVISPSSQLSKEKHLRGWRLVVDKAYVSDIKLTKDTKNFKHRKIPLSPAPTRLFMRIKQEHILSGGNLDERIFSQTHGAVNMMICNVCKKLKLQEYNCHEFRHTFISNLIRKGVPLPVVEKVSGDTQETILKRYSHMFESDEMMILNVLSEL